MAMNTPHDGEKSPAAIPWNPCSTPYTMVDTVKNVEQHDLADRPARRQPLAVAAGARWRRSWRHRRTATPKSNDHPVESGEWNRSKTAMADDREGPTQPHRRAGPVQQRGERAGEAAERRAHPHVGAAFLRERRAQLGVGQRRRDEERHEQHQQPRERLRAADRDGTDGVDGDHGRDEEEDGVESTQLATQLRVARWSRVDRLGQSVIPITPDRRSA